MLCLFPYVLRFVFKCFVRIAWLLSLFRTCIQNCTLPACIQSGFLSSVRFFNFLANFLAFLNGSSCTISKHAFFLLCLQACTVWIYLLVFFISQWRTFAHFANSNFFWCLSCTHSTSLLAGILAVLLACSISYILVAGILTIHAPACFLFS